MASYERKQLLSTEDTTMSHQTMKARLASLRAALMEISMLSKDPHAQDVAAVTLATDDCVVLDASVAA